MSSQTLVEESVVHHHIRIPRTDRQQNDHSSVGLLVTSTCTWTAKFLGLAPSVVGNQERTVVADQDLLEGVFAVLIDVFLVVGDLEFVQSQRCKRSSCGMRLCECNNIALLLQNLAVDRVSLTMLLAIACRIA